MNYLDAQVRCNFFSLLSYFIHDVMSQSQCEWLAVVAVGMEKGIHTVQMGLSMDCSLE